MNQLSNFLYLVRCTHLQSLYRGLDIAWDLAEKQGNQTLVNYYEDRSEQYYNNFKDLQDRYLQC